MNNILKAFGLIASLLFMSALPINAQKMSKQKRAELGAYLCDSAIVVSYEENEAKAEPIFWLALKYLEGTEQVERTLVCMRNLGAIKKTKNDTDSALFYFDKALQLAKKVQFQTYEVEFLILKKNVYRDLEKWDYDRECLLKIDSIINITDEEEAAAKGLRYLAKEAYDTGKMDLAENIYKNLIDNFGELDNPKLIADLLLAYYGLYEINLAKRNFPAAADFYGKYIHMMNAKNGESFPDDKVVQFLSLERLYFEADDMDGYCQYEDSVMNIIPRLQDNGRKALAYHFSASYRYRNGDFEKSLDYALKADSIMSMLPDAMGEDRATTLTMIIEEMIELGRYDEARKHMKKFLNVYEQIYGNPSIYYAKGLCRLANLEAFMGDVKTGGRYYIDGSKMMMEKFREQMRQVSSERREGYWQNFSDILFAMAGYGYKAGFKCDDFTTAAYNALLFSKGLLLASDRSVAEIISEKGTEEDLALYNEINQLRTELEAMSASGDTDSKKMEAMYAKLLSADNRLVAQCAAYDDIDKFADDDFEKVKSALGKNDVLVDLTHYYSASKGKHQYMAFIVTRDREFPLLIPVCLGEQVDSLVGGVKSFNSIYTSLAEELSQICLKPLLPYFNGKGTMYVVPSGMYHQIALEALPVKGGLACDKYHIARLTSARELCKPHRDMSGKVSATLYGGLNYDITPEEMAMESAKYDVSSLFALRGDDLRSGGTFSQLPFTKTEVENIQTTLKERADVNLLEGNSGTEESFLAMSGHSPEIIHLATHGFYYTPQEAMETSSLAGYQNAMHLSGLVMAGGNAAVKGVKLADGTLEGLLTADDIARLNLGNTRLICLSACDTGKGKVTSDGVYGLQRALKKAGVESIVMSLWQASDIAANLFMTEFYKVYGNGKWDAHKAFNKARNKVRKQFPEPFYWAGFVLLD